MTFRDAESPRELVKSVQSALDLLNAFAREASELSISELARSTGLLPSTVHRLVTTLQSRSFVEQNPVNRRYRLGLAALRLGWVADRRLILRQVSRPTLERLAKSTGATTSLALLHEGQVLYIDRAYSGRAVQVITNVGSMVEPHLVAVGKALLAHLPSEETEAYLASPLRTATRSSVSDPEALRAQLAEVRRAGFALAAREYDAEVTSVACVIRDADNQVVAAVGVADTSYRLKGRRLKSVTAQVMRAAGDVTAALVERGKSRATG